MCVTLLGNQQIFTIYTGPREVEVVPRGLSKGAAFRVGSLRKGCEAERKCEESLGDTI